MHRGLTKIGSSTHSHATPCYSITGLDSRMIRGDAQSRESEFFRWAECSSSHNYIYFYFSFDTVTQHYNSVYLFVYHIIYNQLPIIKPNLLCEFPNYNQAWCDHCLFDGKYLRIKYYLCFIV